MKKNEHAKKNVIWALYDDAESSYKKAIKKFFDKMFEVHSIGINDISFREKKNYFYHKIDLSLNNFNLIKQLKALPHPDIILASPPCESWSGADCAGKMTRKIDEQGNWIVQNAKFYDEYNKKCHPVKRRSFINKERNRIIGESTIGATINIIKYFDPKFWVIENPQTSKTWEFQRNHWNFYGIENKTYYSTYDENFSLKPTIFKSNIKLHLKKERKNKSNKNHMALGSYSLRSSIPDKLIEDIMNNILKQINKY